MKQSAYQYSLYLLSGQDYSEYKLRQKLKLKGFEAPEIEETLTRLIEKNYLRQEEYQRLLTRKLIAKGYSDSLIKRRAEQESLQIDSTDLQAQRSDLDLSSQDIIIQLIKKKLRSRSIPTDKLEKQKLKDKVLRFVLSKGHSYQDCKTAIESEFKTFMEAE